MNVALAIADSNKARVRTLQLEGIEAFQTLQLLHAFLLANGQRTPLLDFARVLRRTLTRLHSQHAQWQTIRRHRQHNVQHESVEIAALELRATRGLRERGMAFFARLRAKPKVVCVRRVSANSELLNLLPAGSSRLSVSGESATIPPEVNTVRFGSHTNRDVGKGKPLPGRGRLPEAYEPDQFLATDSGNGPQPPPRLRTSDTVAAARKPATAFASRCDCSTVRSASITVR
ncbi:hypothetical protein SAMN05216345_1322 [Cupriavidus sp. YR651]|nr:hypothetical protein SAMN05216345_1322 [Cupriavidus sp. YR651]